MDQDKCRLCGESRETVQHLLAGCKKIAGSEYVRRHDNALKVLAVQWAIDNGLLPEGTKWYTERWERGKVIENNGKKLFWDWEHRMRTSWPTLHYAFWDWEHRMRTSWPTLHYAFWDWEHRMWTSWPLTNVTLCFWINIIRVL